MADAVVQFGRISLSSRSGTVGLRLLVEEALGGAGRMHGNADLL